MTAFVVMLVMCMGAVLALSLVLVSALLSKLPRHPLRAPDSHGPVHSYGHLQDWSVEAPVAMLLVFMALSLALVCVAPLCTLLPMLVTPTRKMHALMLRFPLLVCTLRCSCTSLADSSYHANAMFRQRPKASAASTQA